MSCLKHTAEHKWEKRPDTKPSHFTLSLPCSPHVMKYAGRYIVTPCSPVQPSACVCALHAHQCRLRHGWLFDRRPLEKREKTDLRRDFRNLHRQNAVKGSRPGCCLSEKTRGNATPSILFTCFQDRAVVICDHSNPRLWSHVVRIVTLSWNRPRHILTR